jgi:uncharacterized protein involved in tolerance to divalent cations
MLQRQAGGQANKIRISKSNNKVIWVLVNSNNVKEAKYIGGEVLKKRLAACYGLIEKLGSKYYWPPKSNRFEQNKGPLLVLETFPKNYKKISALVKKLHSDKVPFIGSIKIENVSPEFFNWMRGEIK